MRETDRKRHEARRRHIAGINKIFDRIGASL